MWLLEDKIRKLVAKEGDINKVFDPKQRGMEIAGQVMRSMTDYSRDPETLYRAQRQLINEIMDLDAPPLLFVHTNPPEWSRLHDRDPVEVFGLTAPGAQVTVNGKELPVSAEGFFGDVFYVAMKADDIVVRAASGGKKKMITRKFSVVY